jgi:16S rRNA (cytidine1402-2'-O)-methyltransferase
MLKSLKDKEYTTIIYESVHRIEKTLEELEGVFGTEHRIVVGREITKKFEEFRR